MQKSKPLWRFLDMQNLHPTSNPWNQGACHFTDMVIFQGVFLQPRQNLKFSYFLPSLTSQHFYFHSLRLLEMANFHQPLWTQSDSKERAVRDPKEARETFLLGVGIFCFILSYFPEFGEKIWKYHQIPFFLPMKPIKYLTLIL